MIANCVEHLDRLYENMKVSERGDGLEAWWIGEECDVAAAGVPMKVDELHQMVGCLVEGLLKRILEVGRDGDEVGQVRSVILDRRHGEERAGYGTTKSSLRDNTPCQSCNVLVALLFDHQFSM